MAGTKVKNARRQAYIAAMPRDPVTGRLMARPRPDAAPPAPAAPAASGEVAGAAAPFPGPGAGDAPEIRVADLGEPDATPPELAGELDGSDAAWAELVAEAEPEDWVGWVVDRLIPIARAPFELVALRWGAHWRVTDDEVRPIVAAIVPAVPRTAIAERLVAASPLVAAAIQAAELVRARLLITSRKLEEARRARADVQPGGPGRGPGDDRAGVPPEDHGPSDAPGARADGAVAGTGPSLAFLGRLVQPPRAT